MKIYISGISIDESPLIWIYDKNTKTATCTYKTLANGEISHKEAKRYLEKQLGDAISIGDDRITLDLTLTDKQISTVLESGNSRKRLSSSNETFFQPAYSILLEDIITEAYDSEAYRSTVIYLVEGKTNIITKTAKTITLLQSYQIIDLANINLLLDCINANSLNEQKRDLCKDLKTLLIDLNKHYKSWPMYKDLDKNIAAKFRRYFKAAVEVSVNITGLQTSIADEKATGAITGSEERGLKRRLLRFYALFENIDLKHLIEPDETDFLKKMEAFKDYLSSCLDLKAFQESLEVIKIKMLAAKTTYEGNVYKPPPLSPFQSIEGFFSFKTALDDLLSPKEMDQSPTKKKGSKDSPKKAHQDKFKEELFEKMIALLKELAVKYSSLITISDDANDIFISKPYLENIEEIINAQLEENAKKDKEVIKAIIKALSTSLSDLFNKEKTAIPTPSNSSPSLVSSL